MCTIILCNNIFGLHDLKENSIHYIGANEVSTCVTWGANSVGLRSYLCVCALGGKNTFLKGYNMSEFGTNNVLLRGYMCVT